MRFFYQNIIQKYKNTYKYYRSIDYLPLFNFFKVHETEDLRFLIRLDNYESLPENVNLEELQNIWQNISNEYSEAENSNSTIIQFTTAKSVHKLELEYLMLYNLHELMRADLKGETAKKRLEYAGLKGKDIKWITKRLKILSNQIRIKRKDIQEKNNNNEKIDFYRIVDEISDIKGREIDIFKTTVRQYIAIKKNIKQKNGRQNKTRRCN